MHGISKCAILTLCSTPIFRANINYNPRHFSPRDVSVSGENSKPGEPDAFELMVNRGSLFPGAKAEGTAAPL